MKVIHLGNIANVPYFLCYGLSRKYNIDTLLVVEGEQSNRFVYGQSDNPYNVNVLSLRKKEDYLRFLSEMSKADILHCHSNTSCKQFLFASFPRLKFVRHFHGSDIRTLSQEERTKLYAASKIFKEKVLISTFDLINNWKSAEYLPNPLEPVFFGSYSSEEEYSIFLPTKYEPIKNISVALKAWEILRELDKNVVLKTIRYGECSEFFYQKYGKDDRIKFLPVMNKEQFVKELQKSAIVWGQFSKYGVVGLTELEAMAARKPVFAYVNPAIHNIDYLPPVISTLNPKFIAEKSCQLLANPDRRRDITEKCGKWVDKHHSIESVTENLVKIYRKMVYER